MITDNGTDTLAKDINGEALLVGDTAIVKGNKSTYKVYEGIIKYSLDRLAFVIEVTQGIEHYDILLSSNLAYTEKYTA